MQGFRPEAIGGGHFFDLCFVHLSEFIEKGLGLCLVGAERIQRHSPVRLFARLGDLLHRIVRSFPAKNIFAVGIRKVINLFWLPGTQVLEKWFETLAWTGNLFGECSRIARHIECLGREKPRGLMVPVVFADKCARKKCENDFRPSQPNQAH